MSDVYQITPIARVHSPFKEKFAIPRQPGLVQPGECRIELLPPFNQVETVRGLEQFTHLWLVFMFHHHGDKWQPLVRPPRLGGNQQVGVFASRSSYRPNALGLSCCELKQIEVHQKQIFLITSLLDLVDGTPIVDIKPYLPWSDSLPDAKAGYAQDVPQKKLKVESSPAAAATVRQWRQAYPDLESLIHEVLSQDPRPAYHANKNDTDRIYGMKLYQFEVRFRIQGETCLVVAVTPVED